MMKYTFSILFLFILTIGIHAQNNYFSFSLLPDLPPNSGYSTQPGLAGPYAGMDDGVLIVAGGANFTDKLPWEGGTKVFYDEIFILKKIADEKYTWEKAIEKIPYASAYGGAVETSNGLLCFGGNTTDKCISDSWFIEYSPVTGNININPGPALPVPLTNFAFAKVDGNLYVAGGLTELTGSSGNHFFRLQMSGNNPLDWTWKALPPLQGKPRAFAVGVGQSNGEINCFYLFSGRNIQPGQDPEILYDAHIYNPYLEQWSVISDGGQIKFPFMAGTAFPVGAATIVFPSGANGEMMKKQLETENQIAALAKTEANKAELDSLQNALLNHLNNHPGFGNQLMAFNTITKEIYNAGQLPETGQVTTTAVKWRNQVFIPSGEIRPGVRTPGTLIITINQQSRHLGFLDMVVIALYFLVLSWMGWFFSKRQKNTDDYFKGGSRIPWWAAGLSIFGTALSSITFMAIPAKTFATDWSYFMFNMTIFMVAPIIIFLFIPFYRKLNITTVYEYLERRFNTMVRLIGSLSFILFQVGRMGVVMFLPSIALNVVTGIDIFVCIGLMGIVSIVYTMMGGIEAVIWTDVMQVIVLLGGAILSLVLIVLAVDGGFTAVIQTGAENNKFNLVDFTWSLKQPTVWVMLLGGVFTNIITYSTDQTMVQRYLTTKSDKAANNSMWTNAILVIPSTLIFFFIGTALFVFYKSFPSELNPAFENNDSIFPWYIASQLPAGISGLLIAGIFAAAMSTLSSSINSAATAYATDIHFRFGWNKKKNELKIARWASLIIGVTGILFAFLMATMDVKSLWDEFNKILGLVLGGLGGLFLLGLTTRKANSIGALAGIVGCVIVQLIIMRTQQVHLLLYSTTGFVSCFVIGYLVSLIFKDKKEIHFLTIYKHSRDINNS
jgi:SSS family solute:Na+ symporter